MIQREFKLYMYVHIHIDNTNYNMRWRRINAGVVITQINSLVEQHRGCLLCAHSVRPNRLIKFTIRQERPAKCLETAFSLKPGISNLYNHFFYLKIGNCSYIYLYVCFLIKVVNMYNLTSRFRTNKNGH